MCGISHQSPKSQVSHERSEETAVRDDDAPKLDHATRQMPDGAYSAAGHAVEQQIIQLGDHPAEKYKLASALAVVSQNLQENEQGK